MKKHIIRIVSLLLVPCLMADPVTSGGFTRCGAHTCVSHKLAGDAFSQQAITAYLLSSQRLIRVLHAPGRIGVSFVKLLRHQVRQWPKPSLAATLDFSKAVIFIGGYAGWIFQTVIQELW